MAMVSIGSRIRRSVLGGIETGIGFRFGIRVECDLQQVALVERLEIAARRWLFLVEHLFQITQCAL